MFAIVAVWWLLFRADAGAGRSWIVEDDAAKTSLAERVGDWFKLANLNFHGIYPWVLLAPYVAWLGLRFTLERGRWRASVAAHLAGCAAFAVASHIFASRSGMNSRSIVSYTTEYFASDSSGGHSATNVIQTNEVRIVSNGPLPPLTNLPPGMGGGFGRTGRPGLGGNFAGAGAGMVGGGPGQHDSFFWSQGASHALSDVLNVFAYASLVGIAQAFHFHRRSKERERRAAVLETQLAEARLGALQAQLHPHFLFNALNAISTLLRRDTRAAQDALASFSDLLRLALSQSSQPEVPLCEDLRFLRHYVEIQTMRLGERLRVEEAIPADILECLVPVLLLQPLVENAIRHGIEPSPKPGLVRVAVEANGARLSLTVEDNGVGLSSPARDGIGLGLENLRARLKTLYGAEQCVELTARPEGGARVRVEIPLRRASAPK
ncbi:MAG TPA: histidine kinase [Verrucomicrobiae bacterium]